MQRRMTVKFERKKTIIQKKMEKKSAPKAKESEDFVEASPHTRISSKQKSPESKNSSIKKL